MFYRTRSGIIRQFHVVAYLVVHIFGEEYPEVVVALRIAGYLRYFLEAKVIIKPFFKREYYVHEVFTQLGYISHALIRIGNTYHGFGGLYSNMAKLFKLSDKVMEQHKRMLRLPGKESLQVFG